MASWFRKTIPILKHIEPIHVVLSLSLITLLLIIELSFESFKQENISKSWQTISALLEKDSNSGNSYQISRALSDIEKAGLIRCVVLKEKNKDTSFYDTSYTKGCSYGKTLITKELISRTGFRWIISFLPITQKWLLLTKYLIHALIALLILFLLKLFRSKNIKLKKQILYNKQKDDLVHNTISQIRHDIASPIGAIKIVAKQAPLPDEFKNLLTNSINRTESILQDFSNFDGIQKIRAKKYVELSQILTDIMHEKTTSDLKVGFEADLRLLKGIMIKGSATEISRMFSNIFNNSIEAKSFDCNIKIKIECKVLNSSSLCISIKDNGKGIPTEYISSIFQRGFSHGKDSQKQAGTGLGLHHAKATMNNIGGQISINSKENEGTEIVLVFTGFSIPK